MNRFDISRILAVFLGGFLFAVSVQSFVPGSAASRAFFIFALSVAVIVSFGRNSRRVQVFAFVFALASALGFFRAESALTKTNDTTFDGARVSGVALVRGVPSVTENGKRVTIRFVKCETESGARCEGVQAFFNAEPFAVYRHSDRLHLLCRLETPENFSDDFDWRMYLAARGTRYECEGDQSATVSVGGGVYRALFWLREAMEENISRAIPFPEAGLAGGILFGGSAGMSPHLKDVFAKTSLTHITAVSGYNVTILAQYAMALGIFFGLWRRQAFWFSVSIVIVFIAMIGFPASGLRAGVMGILILWAMRNGRIGNAFIALFFAAAVMLAANPLLLRFDVGFQLSVLATLGIIALSPLWERYRPRQEASQMFFDIFTVTISAQIFVLPIILANFHSISLFAPITNLLVLLTIPAAMLFSFMAAALGFLSDILGMIAGLPAFALLRYDIIVAEFVSRIPFQSLTVGGFGVWLSAVWYAVLGVAVWYIRFRGAELARQRCKRYARGAE